MQSFKSLNTNNARLTTTDLAYDYRNPRFSASENYYCSLVTPRKEMSDNIYRKLINEVSGSTTFDAASIPKTAKVKELEAKHEDLEKKLSEEEKRKAEANYKKEEAKLKILKEAIKEVDESKNYTDKPFKETYYQDYPADDENPYPRYVQKVDPRNDIILTDPSGESISYNRNGELSSTGEYVHTYESARKEVQRIESLLNTSSYKESDTFKNSLNALNTARARQIKEALEADQRFLKKMIIKSGGRLNGIQYAINQETGVLTAAFSVRDAETNTDKPIALLRFNTNDMTQNALTVNDITDTAYFAEGTRRIDFTTKDDVDISFYFGPDVTSTDPMFYVERQSNLTLDRINSYNDNYRRDPEAFGISLKNANPNDKELQGMFFERKSRVGSLSYIQKGAEDCNQSRSQAGQWLYFLPALGLAAAASGAVGYAIGASTTAKAKLSKRREYVAKDIKNLGEDLTKVKDYMKANNKDPLTGLNENTILGLVHKANDKQITALEKQFARLEKHPSLNDALKNIAKTLSDIQTAQKQNIAVTV